MKRILIILVLVTALLISGCTSTGSNSPDLSSVGSYGYQDTQFKELVKQSDARFLGILSQKIDPKVMGQLLKEESSKDFKLLSDTPTSPKMQESRSYYKYYLDNMYSYGNNLIDGLKNQDNKNAAFSKELYELPIKASVENLAKTYASMP